MANNQEDLIAAVGMDLDSWDDGMRQMLSDERKIEQSLAGVVDSANDAEKALNSIDGSIDLDVDTSDLEKAKRIVEDIDGMGGAIDLSVDESELDTVRRLIADIDSDAPTVNIEVDDSEVESAKDEVDDIDNATPTVDVDVDKDEVDEANALLEQIRNMAVIDLVMNVTGNIQSVFDTLTNLPGIGSIVEMDNAMGSFEGRTGRAGVQLENLVDDLHGQGMVAGREQIGEIATLSSQLGIAWGDTDDAVTATLNTISVTGGDANETLTTMNNLVEAGLVGNFQEASDLIVSGLQSGADRGGDLLDVLNEYTSTFREMGIDGPSALSLINSGLEAGFGNADRVADSVREMGIRVRELDPTQIDAAMTSFANGETTIEELNTTLGETGAALNELDLLDETEAFLSGDMNGEDFFNSVIAGLQGVQSESERARLAVQIFGTQAEDIGVGAITSLTTEGFDNIEGAAQEAADSMTDTIGGSVVEVQQLIDDMAVAFFNSDQIDIQGKLDDMKARIQTFVDQINSGATFGEALEIALDAPGLEEKFHELEGFLGDFLLALADIFADVLSIIPGQEAAAEHLRDTVAEMAGGQLVFDLSVADEPQVVADAVTSAIDRGVEMADIGTGLSEAFDAAMASGDVDAAQAIADYIANTAGTGISEGLYDALTNQGTEAMFDAAPLLAEELGISLDDAIRMINMGTFRDLPINPTVDIDTAAMQSEIDQAMLDMHAAVDVDLASGNVTGAAELAESMGSSLFNEFNRLVSEGTEESFQLAANIAAGAPELGLDITSVAQQAGMSDESIAELESNAQAAVAATTTATQQLTDATTAAETDATTALDTAGDSFTNFSGEASSALTDAGTAANNYEAVVATAMLNVGTNIDAAAAHFQALIDAAQNAQEAVSTTVDVVPVAPTIDENAEGGVFSGLSWVGEAGPEIISSDTSLAVLNNATSESILSGLAALLGGGYTGGGGGGSVTINQTNTFNNSGGAASTASLDNASRAIRGY